MKTTGKPKKTKTWKNTLRKTWENPLRKPHLLPDSSSPSEGISVPYRGLIAGYGQKSQKLQIVKFAPGSGPCPDRIPNRVRAVSGPCPDRVRVVSRTVSGPCPERVLKMCPAPENVSGSGKCVRNVSGSCPDRVWSVSGRVLNRF